MRGAGPRRGFSILELMIVVAIVGILAAIAVPNFMRFQARAKQSEAKGQLKAIFTGERTRFGEKDAFSPFVQDLGFAPERGNRYAYRLSAGCANPEVRGAGAIANATRESIQGPSASRRRWVASRCGSRRPTIRASRPTSPTR